MKKPLVLCIMDGYGISLNKDHNAIALAKKPNLDALFSKYPSSKLFASGEEVGLPAGQMGNSEVGHLNIGAGRIVYQALTYINKQIKDGDFYKNKVLVNATKYAKAHNDTIHIFGLLSNGGVHSDILQILASIDLAKQNKVKNCYIHAFLDGRDVPPQSAKTYIKQLLDHIEKISYGKLATISGRFYTMDRDKNFTRLAKGYDNLTAYKGTPYTDPYAYIDQQYLLLEEKGETLSDEYIHPGYNPNVKGKVSDGDSIIFANFRPDRAIQLATIFTNPLFYPTYKPEVILKDINLVCFMKYADSVKGDIAFSLESLEDVLGVVLAKSKKTQLRIAETEKYAHVTYFFDGGVNYDGKEKPTLEGSERILVASPKVETYSTVPQMSASLVGDGVVNAIESKKFDVIIVNFANCDMVGHTGNLQAAITAVETVDTQVGRIVSSLDKVGGVMLLTADHGNAEVMEDPITHAPHTAHTTNLVPFLITDSQVSVKDGKLSDIAPTILDLLQIKIPTVMSRCVLIQKKEK